MTQLATRCPRCAGDLATVAGDAQPWCPACEWNLGTFDEVERPDGPPVRGLRRWLTRRSREVSFALNRVVFDEVSGRRPIRPRVSRTRFALSVISVLFVLVSLGFVVFGVYLVLCANVVLKLVGLMLGLMGADMRPRLPRMRAHPDVWSRTTAPALYAFVDDLSRRLGAAPVERIVVNDSFNAKASCYGLGRHRVLTIGLPLWAALGPEARVVLLGHELGHFVNGDPARSLLCQPAVTTFARLAAVLDPSGGGPTRRRRAGSKPPLVDVLAAGIWYVIFTPVHRALLVLQLLVTSIEARARMRAEYLADAIAVNLGGSAGAAELMASIVDAERVRSAVTRAARKSADPQELRVAADAARRRPDCERRLVEQHSLRVEASVFRSHPASGLRARAVRSWGYSEPRLVVDPDVMRRIDAELAGGYRRMSRLLTLT